MNRLITLLLVVLAVLMVVFLAVIKPHLYSIRGDQLSAGYLLDFDALNIHKVTLVNGTQTIRLKKIDNQWKLLKPIQDEASSEMVHRILQGLKDLRSMDRISASEIRSGDLHLKDFGLYSPKQWMEIQGDKKVRITFGKDAAGSNQIYVRLDDSDDVYLVSDTLRDLALSPLDLFREQKLSTLNVEDVASFSLQRASGILEVQRKGGKWMMTKPFHAEADTVQVEKLLNGFLNLKISKFVPDGSANLTTYGIIEGKDELVVRRRGKAQDEKIRFGDMADEKKSQIYVQSESRDLVAEVPSVILDLLVAAIPDNLRDRQLVHLQLDVIDRIQVTKDGQTLLLLRKGNDWIAQAHGEEQSIAAKTVEDFVYQLESVRIASFHEATDDDFKLCGLNPPMAILDFSAWLSENSAEDEVGEKKIIKMTFGQSETGRNFARLNEDPEALALNIDMLSWISVDPMDWRNATFIKPVDPASVASPSVISLPGKEIAPNHPDSSPEQKRASP